MHAPQFLFLLPLAATSVLGSGHFITPSSPTLSKRASCSNVLSPSYQSPIVGSGWVAQIIAQSLTAPRSILFDSSGGMLVLEQKKGITRLTFSFEDDTSTCLVEQSRDSVVADSDLLHGLALSKDGKTLYASTSDMVYSWPYDSAAGTVTAGDRKTLVQGMSSGGHVTRTILLLDGEGKEGMMLVSRGSDGNLDLETQNEESGKSQIRAFNLTAMDPAGENFQASAYMDGQVIGWGLRNSVGLGQDPVTGGIWSVENSADDMRRLGQDIHTDNPGEELNFHGYLNGSETEGKNFGYPDCFALWGTDNFPEIGNMTVGSQFANEGSEKTDQQCQADTQAPRLTFQAHMAPLDVLVPDAEGVVGLTNTDDNSTEREMYITFHGSWDRSSPVGYALASIALDAATGQPVADTTSKTATTLIISNPDNSKCPDGCFRPVGLAMDAQRRLFMTSDATGEVYVLTKADFSTGNLPGAGGDGGASAALGIKDSLRDNGAFAMAVGCSSLAAIALGGFVGLR